VKRSSTLFLILTFSTYSLQVKRVIVAPDHTQWPVHSVRILWTRDRPKAETSTWQHTTLKSDRQPYPMHTRDHSKWEAADPRLRVRLHWSQNRQSTTVLTASRQGSTATLLFMSAATMKPIGLACCLLTTSDCMVQQNRFVLSRQPDQTPAADSIWFAYSCSRQNLSDRTCERYAAFFGTKETKTTWTEISSPNARIKYERN
jgi:hypothetical protein